MQELDQFLTLNKGLKICQNLKRKRELLEIDLNFSLDDSN